MEIHQKRIRDEAGRATGFRTFLDITQRKRAEQTFHAQADKLARSNQSWNSSPMSPRTICKSRCAISRLSATG